MIVLNRVTSDGSLVEIGVPLTNVSEVSPHKDEKTRSWVKYWNGQEIRSMVVDHTVKDVQQLMFVARHGKVPAKGVL